MTPIEVAALETTWKIVKPGEEPRDRFTEQNSMVRSNDTVIGYGRSEQLKRHRGKVTGLGYSLDCLISHALFFLFFSYGISTTQLHV